MTCLSVAWRRGESDFYAAMRIVDSHVHLYPPAINGDPAAWAAAHGESHWAVMCARVRRTGRHVQAFPSVDELLRAMDSAQVDHAVLLGWYWNTPESCELQNRFYAECVRAHPARLSAFATLHPSAGRERTIAQLRAARDAGLCGLGELSPHSQRFACDDPVFEAALGLAAEFRWPVNLHVTDAASGGYPGRVETPLDDFVQLAQKFPAVNFILAHWGGRLPLVRAETANVGNLFYDAAATPLLYRPEVWPAFLTAFPPDRVLFGSDFPLNLYPRADDVPVMQHFIRDCETAGAGESFFSGNGLRLLGRTDEPA